MRDIDCDVLIVGAGFAGLYALQRLRALGFDARALEAGAGVGGTWYWNRYPGARCDIESLEYSYQFSDALQQEWDWSERYASQPEILRYLNYVADLFGLRRHIQLGTRVRTAQFDEPRGRWLVSTSADERLGARWLVLATGCLSRPNKPRFAGLERFHGPSYHTGEWPHEPVDFRGLKVGVIGTGSSAVQSIPYIAGQAEHVWVFQRTPTYSIPARNAPLDPETLQRVKRDYAAYRAPGRSDFGGANFDQNPAAASKVDSEERRRVYDARWARGGLAFLGAFSDLLVDRTANESAADYVRGKIRAVVQDLDTADLLCPTQTFACKRLCVDSGYYETFNRSNVRLVDVRSAPIEGFLTDGPVAGGKTYCLDAIVFATGFDAMTGAMLAIDIRGRGGESLQSAWSAGPRTYLGLATAGFPNLFMISGPGSPSVLSNMVVSIEQHVEWIADCIAHAGGAAVIEASREAQDAWVDHVNEVAHLTLFPSCNSWYLGANVPGKPRLFMPYAGGLPAYRDKCAEVTAKDYEGFHLTSVHG